MSSLTALTENHLVRLAYRKLRNMLEGPGWGGFHRDRIYRSLMLDLVEAIKPTAFVETGTFRGYSTELIAARHPELQVLTCEVMPRTHQAAKLGLRPYPNISASLGNSDEWLAGLLEERRVGDRPLFFLDAHWQSYWPLRAELKHITRLLPRAVVVIDDFEVPGQAQFAYDLDGGSGIGAGEKCNLDYIMSSLAPQNHYDALFPKYALADAFGSGRAEMAELLRGHIVLFQNMPEEYQAYLTRDLPQRYYRGYGLLAPAGASA